jgi:hypothetical protein
MQAKVKIGEVVESSVSQYTAHCYELFQTPPLGCLVTAHAACGDIGGIVAAVTTQSLEPGRRPIARGRDEASEEALFRQNPQLLKLFRTDITVLVSGYHSPDAWHCYLPPQPASIHSFVYTATPEEVQAASSSFDFLNLFLDNPVPLASHELAAAAIRQMSLAYPDPHAFLIRAGKRLAALLYNDLNGLNAILRRIKG